MNMGDVAQTCQLKEDRVYTDVEVKKYLLEQIVLRDIPDLQLLTLYCLQFCFEDPSF